MRLDNRTRVIIVSGEEAGSASAREYFEGTGGNVENVEGGVKVGYPTREMAERVSYFTFLLSARGRLEIDGTSQVLAVGTKDIPNLAVGISATWHAPTGESNGGGGEVEMVEDDARRGDHDEED